MIEDVTEELTRPDLHPERGAEPPADEARFEARCPDREEFIVAYQAFVQEDTLVLPQHPHLVVGAEGDFAIVLRGSGSPLLRGRCRVVEPLSETRGLERVSKAVRVQVLELDEGCRDLHQRLVARSRFRGSAGFRLPRLELLLQTPSSRPPPAVPVRLTARAAARPRPVVPLRPEDRKQPPPAPRPAVPSPTSMDTPAAIALPVLEVEPDPVPERAPAGLMLELRGQLLHQLHLHRRLIVAGALGFVLGLAARGQPHPRRLPETAAEHTAAPPVTAVPAAAPEAPEAPPPPPAPEVVTAAPASAVVPPAPPLRHRRGAHRRRHAHR